MGDKKKRKTHSLRDICKRSKQPVSILKNSSEFIIICLKEKKENFQPSVRKTHNAGRKHKDNVRTFYQEWLDKQTASLMDRSRPMTGLPVVGQQQLRAAIPSAMMMNPMMSQMMGQMAGMRPGMVPQMQMRPMMQPMMRPMMGAPMMV